MRIFAKLITLTIAVTLAIPPTIAHASIPANHERSGVVPQTTCTQKQNHVSLLAKSSSKKRGLVKEGGHYYFYAGGKKAKRCWKTVKGSRYYFKANGRAATGSLKVKGKYYIFDSKGRLAKAKSKKTPKVVKVGSVRYLSDSKGRAVKGWQVISGKLYHASSSGKCAASKTYDKIPFTKYGYAKPKNDRTKLMILALNIVKKITNDKMSQTEKLNACFDYVNSFPWRSELFPPNGTRVSNNTEVMKRVKPGWQIKWAYKTLTEQVENCWGLTCGFNALAKALGEDPYIICDVGIHTSSRINGKYWDRVGYILGGEAPYFKTNKKLTTRFW